MQRKQVFNPVILILFIFSFYKFSFALILPETPDGKTGKNYQLYGFFTAGSGISEKDINFSTNYYIFGLRSNLGTDYFDFGIFYNIFSSFMGLSTDIKYSLTRSKNFSFALDLSLSKPFMDGFLIKTGTAINLTILSPFELIFSSFYIYSFTELKTKYDISFPHGYSIYFYSGIGFQPPFLIDNTFTLGCGYLYMPDNLNDRQKFFNQVYVNFFIRYAFNEPKITRKSLSVNNIIKDKKQEDIMNENILTAKDLIKIKEYKKAILILSETLYFYPDDFTLNYLLGNCYYQTGDKIKAFIYYKKSYEINTIDLKLKDFLKELETEIKNEKK